MKEYLLCWSLLSLVNMSAFYCYKKYNEVQSPILFYHENRSFYRPLIDDDVI